MQDNEESTGAPRTGVATNIVDAAVALVLLAVGIVVIVESRRLGAGWTSDGPGSGYFPFWIGLILSISAAGILYEALLGKNRNTQVFVDAVQLKRVMSVLLPATLYVAVVSLLGLYLASAIYIALFMIVLGKYSRIKSVIVALAVNATFFFMFEVWFKVPLFKGALDPLRFLGY
ncbi:tripartite tricarboxylate transporter TctB family protein [Variovorax saccharolyticus]|uniref:tripartite tricarboxylate transporter TctB family protein n=1 Tax=Variovorax saccharolyticus TaxID=3053516 RepID=UPI0025783BA3|nr:tripartite tricarboxylate transporter TctB family protein [Variovorax sp. J31P216]MDM0026573.1 tripartite tricarboxylate transporter TctB family protein [Variovorax sp. J31P216]